MRVHSLMLKGFRGIRDGMGRDVLELDFDRLAPGAALIAIAGANGRGKTTVMDNLQPVMLSSWCQLAAVSARAACDR